MMEDDLIRGLDPDTAKAVQILIAADALAAAGYVKVPRKGVRGFIVRNNQILIVVLVAIALSVLGWSIKTNQDAISQSKTAAALAKKQADDAAKTARAAAASQLVAVQLVCTLERAIATVPGVAPAYRVDLHRYDTELKCKAALAKPHQPIVLPTSPVQPHGANAPHASPSASHASSAPSATPSPTPHATPTKSSSPSSPPSTCRVSNPVDGTCIVH